MLNLRYSAVYNGVSHRSVFPARVVPTHMLTYSKAVRKPLLFVDTNEQRISALSFLTFGPICSFTIGYHSNISLLLREPLRVGLSDHLYYRSDAIA